MFKNYLIFFYCNFNLIQNVFSVQLIKEEMRTIIHFLYSKKEREGGGEEERKKKKERVKSAKIIRKVAVW